MNFLYRSNRVQSYNKKVVCHFLRVKFCRLSELAYFCNYEKLKTIRATMNKTSKNIMAAVALVSAAAFITSCSGEQFHVTGEIANAKDSVLYFEHNGLDGFSVVDSVRLDDEGSFNFSGDKAGNPEFYRLRIADQIINVAIDSTETVTVKAKCPGMAVNYTVDGSYENEKVRELALKQIQLQSGLQQLVRSNLPADSIQVVADQMLSAYKQDVTRNYIYKEPMKAYAYFALFQYVAVGNGARMIFDPSIDPKDVKVFGAVATSWDTFFPNSERGKNLHNIALRGMNNERIVASQQQTTTVDASKVQETGVLDIVLNDRNGTLRHLTDLKGKVVMLDFHVFSTGEQSQKRILALRELYNKYHDRGFEIYQVSYDDNQHFWSQQVASLPWVSVWDPDGGNSEVLRLYNIQSIPTFFLIDKNNVLQKRDVQVADIDAEIQKLL